MNESGVGQKIKLLDNVSGGVRSSACRASKPLYGSDRNRMRNDFARRSKGAHKVGETCDATGQSGGQEIQ
jgi:hypothetical protein